MRKPHIKFYTYAHNGHPPHGIYVVYEDAMRSSLLRGWGMSYREALVNFIRVNSPKKPAPTPAPAPDLRLPIVL